MLVIDNKTQKFVCITTKSNLDARMIPIDLHLEDTLLNNIIDVQRSFLSKGFVFIICTVKSSYKDKMPKPGDVIKYSYTKNIKILD